MNLQYCKLLKQENFILKKIRIVLQIYFKIKYCYSTYVVIQRCAMVTQFENRPNAVNPFNA